MSNVVGRDTATASVVGSDTLSGSNRSYLVQEEDGVSRFTLAHESGSILLAESAGEGAGVVGLDHAAAEVVG